MSKQTIFKLKDEVTIEDLISAGFVVCINGAVRITDCTDWIYIPLRESSLYGYRVIQYDKTSTSPEELNPEDIEDLVARGWVEEKENE